MYQTIKKFLAEGGRCLLIENDKPIGVILTVEEYELLQNKSEIRNLKSETPTQSPPYQGEVKKESATTNPIGEAIVREMDFPEASAEISDIEAADNVTLEDLGLDELS